MAEIIDLDIDISWLTEREQWITRNILDMTLDELEPIKSKNIDSDLIVHLCLGIYNSTIFYNPIKFHDDVDKKGAENYLMNRYNELINLKKTGFDSRNPATRIKSKYEYYHNAFELRSKIQNYEFDYHHLDKDICKFSKAREITRIIYHWTQKNGIGDVSCPVCNTKILKNELDECPVCKKEKDITLFTALECYFAILGDMHNFYHSLSERIYKKLWDNYDEVLKAFQRVIKVYNSQKYRERIALYGPKQFRDLVIQKGILEIEPRLIRFNKKYNLSLTYDDAIIDLSVAKCMINRYAMKYEFLPEFCSLPFSVCKKLIMPKFKFNTKDLKVDMPYLEILDLSFCNLYELQLNSENFESLKTIYLTGNNFDTYDSIKCLVKFPKLKYIDIHDTPLEKKPDLYDALEAFKDIKMYLLYNAKDRRVCKERISDEEDEDVKSILKKDIDFSISSDDDNEEESEEVESLDSQKSCLFDKIKNLKFK